MNETILLDRIEKTVTLDKPRASYMNGWGMKFGDVKTIIGFWAITIMDIHNYPVTMEFDTVECIPPLIIGLDSTQYAEPCNRPSPNIISRRDHRTR